MQSAEEGYIPSYSLLKKGIFLIYNFVYMKNPGEKIDFPANVANVSATWIFMENIWFGRKMAKAIVASVLH